MNASVSISRRNVRLLACCALFTALTAAGAFFRVPMPYFDYVTLQTPMVLLSGMLLGSRGGALAQSAYVLLGLAGVPVFAGGGGPAYVLKPTFGYLIGFILAAWLIGRLLAASSGRVEARTGYVRYLLAGLAGLAILYGCGIAWRWVITNWVMATPLPLWTLVLSCLTLEIPKDILVCFISAWLAWRLRQRIRL